MGVIFEEFAIREEGRNRRRGGERRWRERKGERYLLLVV